MLILSYFTKKMHLNIWFVWKYIAIVKKLFYAGQPYAKDHTERRTGYNYLYSSLDSFSIWISG